MDCLELFSGGGCCAFGLRAAGLNPVAAIEIDADVAGVYEANHGPHILCQGVETIPSYGKWHGIPFAWASPSCKNASVANQRNGECEADLTAAAAICRMLREARPRGFCLENVRGYARFKSFQMIRDTLDELGYWTNVSVIDAADCGVPQNRKRLILRACLSGIPAPLPPAQRPWNGWLAAIIDIVPTLPPSKFAKWQQDRLSNLFETCLIEGDCAGERSPTVRPGADPAFTLKAAEGGRVARAFLVDGDGNRSRDPSVIDANAPSMTVQAWHGARPIQTPRAFLVDCQNGGSPDEDGNRGLTNREAEEPAYTVTRSQDRRVGRAWLEQGRVVSLSVRALARLQGLPDSMILPDNRRLATSVIGNGVPPKLAEVAARSVLAGMEE